MVSETVKEYCRILLKGIKLQAQVNKIEEELTQIASNYTEEELTEAYPIIYIASNMVRAEDQEAYLNGIIES